MVIRSSYRIWLGIIVLLMGGILSACSSEAAHPAPDELPTRLTLYEQGESFIPVDLDGDGRDERVKLRKLGNDLTPGRRALHIRSHENRTIEQVNYSWPIQPPEFLDTNDDGVLELLVPFVRHDSLFLSIVNARGKKQGQLYITRGEPRVEPEGTLPWDPDVRAVYRRDVNGDGSDELITVVVTQYARLPRGVWVHEWPSGRLLGKKVVGGMIRPRAFEDVDGDGRSELLFVANSSNNGAVAGGMDDRHTYLGAMEVDASPRVEWVREMGGLWTSTDLFVDDFDGDGEREYLTSRVTEHSRPRPAWLHVIDPATGKVQRQFQLGEPLRDIEVVDLRGDGAKEILTLDEGGRNELIYEASADEMIAAAPEHPTLQTGDVLQIEVTLRERFSWRDALQVVTATAAVALSIERFSRVF